MLGRLAESLHVRFEVGLELLAFPRRPFVSEGGFQVPVEGFVWAALRAAGGQVEGFDLSLVFAEPFPDGPAVMDLEVVHEEQDFASGILDQAIEEPDEYLAGQRISVDHPAHLSLIGRRGNHKVPPNPWTGRAQHTQKGLQPCHENIEATTRTSDRKP